MRTPLEKLLQERILVLDGAMGTMIQALGLSEAEYRGERFANFDIPLEGFGDVLALTAPSVLRYVHDAYLLAGADIISTNTFNSTSISLFDYHLEEYAYEVNHTAARVACECARAFTELDGAKPRFVAGSVGPTNRRCPMSDDVGTTLNELTDSYIEQMRGLLDGGVDVILVETIVETLNAQAAIAAVNIESERRGYRVPFMLSVTLAKDGLTLSGDTIEALYASIASAHPLSVGINCGYGTRHLLPYLERLAAISELPVSAHPNAGLPNLGGDYEQTPQLMATDVEELMKRGIVNIVGGCCGTTPEHIGAIAAIAQRYSSRCFTIRQGSIDGGAGGHA